LAMSNCNVVASIYRLYQLYGSKKKWVYFCEDTTQVYLRGLLRALSKFDPENVSISSFT